MRCAASLSLSKAWSTALLIAYASGDPGDGGGGVCGSCEARDAWEALTTGWGPVIRSSGSPVTSPLPEATATTGDVLIDPSGRVSPFCHSWLRKSDRHVSQNTDVASHGLLHRKH